MTKKKKTPKVTPQVPAIPGMTPLGLPPNKPTAPRPRLVLFKGLFLRIERRLGCEAVGCHTTGTWREDIHGYSCDHHYTTMLAADEIIAKVLGRRHCAKREDGHE